ncbi:hypothetical protein CQW23_24088 [Capsicum baccatum]|uniref:Uncharacterized protein n=1 Tax=Capsicum baccatum TaxID=33114 RepID=A0A2G2VTT7_CAPBA|nr:hypothetical protein CQW23_24088 [Capsicum baccatum]
MVSCQKCRHRGAGTDGLCLSLTTLVVGLHKFDKLPRISSLRSWFLPKADDLRGHYKCGNLPRMLSQRSWILPKADDLRGRASQMWQQFHIVETPIENEDVVPNDLKEGYFAVFSVNKEEEPMRFIVELHWLTNPSFLKLMKQAENEYGFLQKGGLEVYCLAAELQKILELTSVSV